MDSRRFLLAVVLMIAVMLTVNIIFPPPQPVPPEPDAAADTSRPAGVTDTATPPATAAPAPDATDTAIAAAQNGDIPEDTIAASSPLREYLITTRGGAIVGAQLNEFNVLQEGREDEPVQLASPELPGLISYRLRIGTEDIPLSSLDFTLVSDSTATSDTIRLRHRGDIGVDLAYIFDPDEYVIDVRMAVTGAGSQVPNLFIAMPRTLARNEANAIDDERALAYVVNNTRDGIRSVRLASVNSERIENGPLHWVAVKNKYFVAATLTSPESQNPFGGLIARPIVGHENAADMEVTLLPGGDGTFAFRLYIGPQEPQRLAALPNNFQDVNPFGFRAFRPILRPLGHAIQWAIYNMHNLLGIGYGWVLILFGVLVRVALWPLNAKAMRSQMKNMEFQPKLKEIQAKYKDRPEQLQKEMRRLMQEEGFNPLGGCLPMLIPFPILITLFFVFQSTIAFRGVGFLWLPDLSRADPYYILPVMLGISMFLMQWLSARSMPEQNPQMKFMMYAMPIMFTAFFLRFASGLNLYYASMNFASIPQQLQIARERRKFHAARKQS